MEVDITKREAVIITNMLFNARDKVLKRLKHGSDRNITIIKQAKKLEEIYNKFSEGA